MRGKHERTLKAIFTKPTKAGIKWRSVIGLLNHLGARIKESKSGSRVGLELNGVRAVFHKPHPGKEIDKGAVESLRMFLLKAKVKP